MKKKCDKRKVLVEQGQEYKNKIKGDNSEMAQDKDITVKT